MKRRKIIGTIIGAIIWACCVVFFTYAYYNWQSENTLVSLTIQDASTSCVLGPEVDIENIGPVLNYQDGVKAEFEVENISSSDSTIGVNLDITTISETLLVKSFKYKLVQDIAGGVDFDYDNPVTEGDFSEFIVGSNVIKSDVKVAAGKKYSFQFIVYIDGSMYNDLAMQVNSMNSVLSIGGCSEAVQTEGIYTVEYDCNEGTGSMASETFLYGVEKQLAKSSCVSEGHDFSGWATSSSGEVVYSDEEVVVNLTNVHRGTVTLYAMYTPKIYNISFYGNKFSTVNQTVNGVEVTYDQDTSELTLNGTQSESFSLMRWENQSLVEGDQYQFTVEYISGEYDCTSEATFATEVLDSNDESLGLAHFHLPTTDSYSALIDITEEMALNGEILYTWLWLKEANTLIFSDYKVKISLVKVEEQEVVYGEAYGTLPEDPTRYGHTFLGWYTSESGGSKVGATTKPSVYEDHTLYARWATNSASVLLVGNGGTITDGKTMTNLITNGSFEDGDSDWTLSNVELTTDQVYDGNYAVKMGASSTAMMRQTLPYSAPTLEHYYYGRTMLLSTEDFTVADSRFEWFYNDNSGARMTFFYKTAATSAWKLLSSVQRLTSSNYLSNSWYFRNFMVNGSDVSYIDANMIIDLTEAFGSGSEIVDTSILDTIPYFDSTMSLEVKDVTYASSYGELPTPTRDGYSFLGWYTSESGGVRVTSSTVVSGDEDHTLYARWQAGTYMLKYDYNRSYTYENTKYMDTGFSINWDEDFTIEETFKITTTGLRYLIIGNYTGTDDKAINLEVNTSNQFRIYTQGSGLVDITLGTVYANEDINIVFEWDASKKTYNVTLTGSSTNINSSGTWDMSGTSSKTLRVGTVDHRGSSATFNKITVSSLEISIPYVYGSIVSGLPEVTQEGFTVGGWYTSASGGTQVTGGSTLETVGSSTLYAHWTANTYTVTLSQSDATTKGTESVTATYDSAMPTITKPVRAYTVTYNYNYTGSTATSTTANYTFGGYYTGTNGSGTQYYTATGASARTWNLTAATTLYAKWTSAAVTLPTPTYSGYALSGWYTAASGGSKVGNSGASYTPTANVTLYAQWVSVAVTAKKSSSGTAVSSGTWSSEGLNFTFTASGQTTGATIQYCQDTANTCTPGTTATSGTAVTSYNTTTGTYYIRYRVKGASGAYSSIKSYTAKVDTTTPVLSIASGEHSIGSSNPIATATYGSSGGSLSCVGADTGGTVTTINSIGVLGIHTVNCTATSNAGLKATGSTTLTLFGVFYGNDVHLGVGSGGYVSGTSIILPASSNAVQYGPYFPTLAGRYKIVYYGNNLDRSPTGYKAYSTETTVGAAYFTIDSLNYLSSDSNYYICISNYTDRLETVLYNYSAYDITISRIEIRPISSGC